MIDIACRRNVFDRLEVRRRNLVPPKAMPYRNPLGLVYDSGDYPASLRRAAELGDWTGFPRREEARRRGRCRGIGVAMSIELNTGTPRERAELTVDPCGTVELVLGTMSAGQGHETSFAQLIAEWLGVEPERRQRGHRRPAGIGAKSPPLITGQRWKRRSDRFSQTLCDSECNLL